MGRAIFLLNSCILLLMVKLVTPTPRCASQIRSVRIDLTQFDGRWLSQEAMPFLEEFPEKERYIVDLGLNWPELQLFTCSMANFASVNRSLTNVVMKLHVKVGQENKLTLGWGPVRVLKDGRLNDGFRWDGDASNDSSPTGGNTAVLAADPKLFLALAQCMPPVAMTEVNPFKLDEVLVVRNVLVLTRRVLPDSEMSRIWGLVGTALGMDISGRKKLRFNNYCF